MNSDPKLTRTVAHTEIVHAKKSDKSALLISDLNLATEVQLSEMLFRGLTTRRVRRIGADQHDYI